MPQKYNYQVLGLRNRHGCTQNRPRGTQACLRAGGRACRRVFKTSTWIKSLDQADGMAEGTITDYVGRPIIDYYKRLNMTFVKSFSKT